MRPVQRMWRVRGLPGAPRPGAPMPPAGAPASLAMRPSSDRPGRRRSSPAAGRLEALDEASCILHTGSNSLDELALHVAVKGFDFQVLHPPELIPVLRALSGRLRDAAAAS
jgi:hypothetical protein